RHRARRCSTACRRRHGQRLTCGPLPFVAEPPMPCKPNVHSLALACLLALGATTSADAAAPRPEVDAAAAKLQAQVVPWRRDFHQHPELSNREQRTGQVIARELAKMGLEPRTGIAG